MPSSAGRKRLRSSPPPSADGRQRTRSSATRTAQSKPTLFDTLDATCDNVSAVERSKALLVKLQKDESPDGTSSDASSGVESDDFEDVDLAKHVRSPKRRRLENGDAHAVPAASDEEDLVREDTTHTPAHDEGKHIPPTGDLQLTLSAVPQDDDALFARQETKKGPSKKEKAFRLRTHCMHVQSLMFHNLIRNSWINDQEVQNILLEQMGPALKQEILRWRTASGIPAPEQSVKQAISSSSAKKDRKGRIRARGGKTASKQKPQRDWGGSAARLEDGVPDLSHGDPLHRLLKHLAGYWKKRFKITAPGLRKLGYKPPAQLRKQLNAFLSDPHDDKLFGERIANLEHFRRLARKCEGSRDVGAQLFTALLRALGIEARMVASLQPLGFGFSKNEEASLKMPKTTKESHAGNDESAEGEADGPRTTSQTKPVLKGKAKRASGKPKSDTLRRPQIAKGITGDLAISLDTSDSDLSSLPEEDDSVIELTPSQSPRPGTRAYDRDLKFPIYWTEAVSALTKSAIPVAPFTSPTHHVPLQADLLSTIFEPRGAAADKAKQVMAYVVAFASDGTAKDVTVRYLKGRVFPGKTKGYRLPAEKVPIYNTKGKVKRWEDHDWFKTLMSYYTRSAHQRTALDELEEEVDLVPVKPAAKPSAGAGAVETLAAYRTSAEYVLERFLRREEALLPGTKPVKFFTSGKGDKSKTEPVYRRKDVVACKTVESWHKEGREIREGQQPLKRVPIRAVTTIRKREIEEIERQTGEKALQGLYAKSQTQWIIPDPIIGGHIPKNAFGNIDVYVPSMIPRGAVHIPLKGTAKVCRKLEIDYAEACTGFEFGNRMAVPVLTGVVVAAEHEHTVIDAWEVAEAEARRKEDAKRQTRAIQTWRKLLMGLRIHERIKDDYAHMKLATAGRSAFIKDDEELRDKVRHTNDKVVQHDDSEIGNGFTMPEHGREDYDGGGGFLLGTQESEGASVADGSQDRVGYAGFANARSAGPISLQSLHRKSNAAEDESSDLSDVSEVTEQDHAAAWSDIEEDSRAGGSYSEEGENQEHDDKLGEDDEDTEVQPTRKLPQRRAARHSMKAVRSHYFKESRQD